ncbi:uncharacterized protein FIBRA_02385 [Fibroporia radiculosa]|uniref:Pal1 cell morphology protein n=1 Tax=Fibroporia radiculosa TaxID=599839 RepID=J4GMU6_9APHY|nr:uncharacterized protein FIBRA_02385 [Fibroporia radiculosa]CCM00355.1 predicted protein [Fibroporia radiculosa]
MNRDQVTEAVREAVQVRSSDQAPRARIGRSNTELPPYVHLLPSTASFSEPPSPPYHYPFYSSHSGSRPSTASRRSHSQDSGINTTNAMDKNKSSGRPRMGKKGSSHADVIDRLDFSGVGPMFHHDGPFDACAPSRNRHKTKAPMMAWSAVTDADKVALASAQEIPRAYESPYPSHDVYVPYEAPKKKYDAIAEAWGIHEPEPFEDFSAGGGHSRFGGDSHSSSRNGTVKRPQDRNPRYREQSDDARPAPVRRQTSARGALPPPQPIFVPEAEGEVASSTEPPSPNGTPRRTKSIIRRIRKMRDSPNVPMGSDDDTRNRDPSPTSSAENSAATHSTSNAHTTRPTHRPQNSFLGRFGRAANIAVRRDGPASDDTGYVYVEDPIQMPINKEKSLPATPVGRDGYTTTGENGTGYFDGTVAGSAGGTLGRKTSLIKKVKGVVKAAKA